jgi:hypothetical protein
MQRQKRGKVCDRPDLLKVPGIPMLTSAGSTITPCGMAAKELESWRRHTQGRAVEDRERAVGTSNGILVEQRRRYHIVEVLLVLKFGVADSMDQS